MPLSIPSDNNDNKFRAGRRRNTFATTTNASRTEKHQAENENTKNLAKWLKFKLQPRAHTFARNEFILQHSRCLFIRLNNISPTSSFAFMRRRAPTTTTTSTTVFPPRRRRRREQKFIFFFTYLCSNPRLNHLRM